MPRDRFKKVNQKRQWQARDRIIEESLLSKAFRMCPSCKQSTVQVKEIESKVVVACKNCFLRYDFTKFPAFEDIDYYDKMRDAFREEVNEGKISPVALAPSDKIVGKCQLCDVGTLALIESYRFKSRFVKCSNPKCNAKFYLPHKGYFEPAKEQCKQCGWPLLYWEFRSAEGSFALFCFNRSCTFKGEWARSKSSGRE